MEQQQQDGGEGLRREIEALEGRDLQLWSIGILILVVVAAGFVALILPNIMWNLGELRLDGRYVPQLFFGFIALIVLFNVYLLKQRRVLRATRGELVSELVRREAAEELSLMDPLTDVFNRRYLERILAKETTRADRRGSSLALMMIDVDGLKAVNTRFGHRVGDRVLTEVAQLLRKNLRLSDTIIRYGGDEFLVLMSDTDEEQAQSAMRRLFKQVGAWNRANSIPSYTMALSFGVAAYSKGADFAEVLEAADQRMFQHKGRSSSPA